MKDIINRITISQLPIQRFKLLMWKANHHIT